MGRQRQQRPLSCRLCRTRKLRCSLVFPCSNCTTRGDICNPQNSDNRKDVSVVKDVSVAEKITAAELLSRLQRLETLVALDNTSQEPQRVGHELEQQSLPSRTNNGYPETNRLSSITSLSRDSTVVQERLQRLTADASKLERSCLGGKPLVSLAIVLAYAVDYSIADRITFRTCSIHLIAKPSSFIIGPGISTSGVDTMEPLRCIWLPNRDQALVLVQKYVSDVSHFHQIVHLTILPQLVEGIYDDLERNNRFDLGCILLLLSICACTIYAWTPHDDARGLYTSATDADSQTTAWLKAALDVIDHCRRMAYASLECIQGMIILFNVLCSLEGVSARVRSLIAESTAMGRELSLHCIDLPNSASSAPLQKNSVKHEMGRRAWWYIVMANWMLSQFSARHEETHTVSPRHMAVRKPRNANDEEIIEGKEVINRSIEEPTSVSYLIQRIRLAEVLHNLLDGSPIAGRQITHLRVMEVDRRLNQFIQEMPNFFLLDDPVLDALPTSDPRRSPSITVQRYALNILINRQLCKLHLPYLIRGIVEPSVAYSRKQCLKSARLVICVEHLLRKETSPFLSFRLRMNIALHGIFLACIVLVLDACSEDHPQDTPWSGEEIADVWHTLYQAQSQSPSALTLLELSIQVLESHRPSHPALKAFRSQLSAMPGPNGGTIPMTPDSSRQLDGGNRFSPLATNSESDSAYLEQQWHQIQGKFDLDYIDWDRVLWDLGAPFM